MDNLLKNFSVACVFKDAGMYVFHNRHYVCVISIAYFLQPEVPEYLLKQPRAAWSVQADAVEVQMATVSLRFNNSEGFEQQSMTYCLLCIGDLSRSAAFDDPGAFNAAIDAANARRLRRER